MKELSIEEKAKAYDEALERAKKYLGDYMLTRQEYVEKVFPELAESGDERIRKEIISMSETLGRKDWIAWLEKQGEQKYTQRDIDDAYLKGVSDVKREVEKQDEQTEKMKKDIAEFIFNSKEDIKHRHDWIKCLGFDIKFYEDKKQGEQKPAAWSEEDESNLDSAIYFIRREPYHEHDAEPIVDWLKSLKDRVQPQSTWKPSEAQMVVLNDIIINGHLSNANERILKGLQEQLKQLM